MDQSLSTPVDLPALLKERGLRLAELARRLQVDKGTVTRWAKKHVPAERVIAIERATGIPRRSIRPDLYPLTKEVAL